MGAGERKQRKRSESISQKLDELAGLLRRQSPERVELIISALAGDPSAAAGIDATIDTLKVKHGNDDNADQEATNNQGDRTNQEEGEETAGRTDVDCDRDHRPA